MEPKRQTEIQEAIGRLATAIEAADKQARALSERIAPVLSVRPTSAPPVNQERAVPVKSQMAGVIDGLSEQVENIRLFLRDATDRVEL